MSKEFRFSERAEALGMLRTQESGARSLWLRAVEGFVIAICFLAAAILVQGNETGEIVLSSLTVGAAITTLSPLSAWHRSGIFDAESTLQNVLATTVSRATKIRLRLRKVQRRYSIHDMH